MCDITMIKFDIILLKIYPTFPHIILVTSDTKSYKWFGSLQRLQEGLEEKEWFNEKSILAYDLKRIKEITMDRNNFGNGILQHPQEERIKALLVWKNALHIANYGMLTCRKSNVSKQSIRYHKWCISHSTISLIHVYSLFHV